MKLKMFTVAMALTTAGAFAQSTPVEVCQKITRVNSTNGNVCAQMISRNTFDPYALSLSSKAVDASGSTLAIEILKTTANKTYNPGPIQVCEKVLAVNGSNVVPCLNTIADARFAPEALIIAQKLLANSSSTAIEALKATANVYLFPPAAEVCDLMVPLNTTNTLECLRTIANKVTANGSEQICKTAISNGSSYALQCLRGILVDYVPVPQPTPVMVELYELQDLRKVLFKTRSQLNRGLIENASRSVEEALNQVDTILKDQVIR